MMFFPVCGELGGQVARNKLYFISDSMKQILTWVYSFMIYELTGYKTDIVENLIF